MGFAHGQQAGAGQVGRGRGFRLQRIPGDNGLVGTRGVPLTLQGIITTPQPILGTGSHVLVEVGSEHPVEFQDGAVVVIRRNLQFSEQKLGTRADIGARIGRNDLPEQNIGGRQIPVHEDRGCLSQTGFGDHGRIRRPFGHPVEFFGRAAIGLAGQERIGLGQQRVVMQGRVRKTVRHFLECRGRLQVVAQLLLAERPHIDGSGVIGRDTVNVESLVVATLQIGGGGPTQDMTAVHGHPRLNLRQLDQVAGGGGKVALPQSVPGHMQTGVGRQAMVRVLHHPLEPCFGCLVVASLGLEGFDLQESGKGLDVTV